MQVKHFTGQVQAQNPKQKKFEHLIFGFRIYLGLISAGSFARYLNLRLISSETTENKERKFIF